MQGELPAQGLLAATSLSVTTAVRDPFQSTGQCKGYPLLNSFKTLAPSWAHLCITLCVCGVPAHPTPATEMGYTWT